MSGAQQDRKSNSRHSVENGLFTSELRSSATIRRRLADLPEVQREKMVVQPGPYRH